MSALSRSTWRSGDCLDTDRFGAFTQRFELACPLHHLSTERGQRNDTARLRRLLLLNRHFRNSMPAGAAHSGAVLNVFQRAPDAHLRVILRPLSMRP